MGNGIVGIEKMKLVAQTIPVLTCLNASCLQVVSTKRMFVMALFIAL